MSGPPTLTIVNSYALTAPVAQFTAAVAALAARVEEDGEPGVLAYHFHASDTDARAVVSYAGPAAWMGHHHTSMHWPEIAALRAAARLTDITVLGPYTPEMRDWLAASGLTATVTHFPRFAGGFVR